jgi:integrase/recombinase XerD
MTEIEVAGPVMAGELAPQQDPIAEFTERWLENRRFSEPTKIAYRYDVRQWVTWCAQRDLHPLAASWLDVNAWSRSLETPDSGRPLMATTIARKMAAVSSWYAFIVKLGEIPANPAAAADRPDVDRDYSATVTFDQEDAIRMLRVAGRGGDPIGDCGPALAAWLVDIGSRASETAAVQVSDLTWDSGHRIVQMRKMKGGRQRNRTIPGALNELIDQYLERRARTEGREVEELEGALFVNDDGLSLDRHDIYRFVRRLARAAGLKNADKITPHSFRHAWNGLARRRGGQLEDRQRAMGHRDPRTTQRYDQLSSAPERDPSLLVAAAVAESLED